MILSHGKLVATVPAQLVELSQAGHDNATESHKNDDGSQSLTQIDFAGKKYALAFGDQSATESASQGGRQRRLSASATGRCGAGENATKRLASGDCLTGGAGGRRPNGCRWPRWNGCWSCIASATSI